jgi:putative ABC transport system permease protein
VANLLLVRAEGRQQELAIRAALGAGWAQIARELLLESVTLGVLGGALGLGFAYAALRLLVAMGPASLPRLDEISIDPPVLWFTLAVSLLAGLLFGLIPVFKYAGRHVASAIRDGGRTVSQGRERHRARSMLVVVQVALALVLLISSGLMIRTFQALKEVQPGFTQPEAVQTLSISIPEAQVPDPDRVVRMHQDILRKIAEVPGVASASLVNSITMDGNDSNDVIFAEGKATSEDRIPPVRRFKFISPDHFKTMGTPLLAGRDLTWIDISNKAAVVMISENLAREYWGDPSAAIGKRIRETMKSDWREIIGVVGNERDDGVDKIAPAVVYWPMVIKDFWAEHTNVRHTATYAVRSSRAGADSFLQQIRQSVWSVNPNLPLANVRTLDEIYRKSMARTSFTLVMLAIAGGMALLLGVVGIYGVISYSVSQRTREIGIRMALGAREPELRRMFVLHGLRLTGIGVACGLAASILFMRLLSSLLFGVSPADPLTYAAVACGLAAAAALASYLPARRATAIDPVEALRAE